MHSRHSRSLDDKSGFTIVELLIVIVVIGILAAIVVVAYNGIVANSKSTQAAANAKTVHDKAQLYFHDPASNGRYPASASQFRSLTGVAALSGSITLSASLVPNTGQIWYVACLRGSDAIGYGVGYWDFAANAPKYYVGGVGFGSPSGAGNGKYQTVGCGAEADSTSED